MARALDFIACPNPTSTHTHTHTLGLLARALDLIAWPNPVTHALTHAPAHTHSRKHNRSRIIQSSNDKQLDDARGGRGLSQHLQWAS